MLHVRIGGVVKSVTSYPRYYLKAERNQQDRFQVSAMIMPTFFVDDLHMSQAIPALTPVRKSFHISAAVCAEVYLL